jgi:hypothetical protein
MVLVIPVDAGHSQGATHAYHGSWKTLGCQAKNRRCPHAKSRTRGIQVAGNSPIYGLYNASMQ